MSCATLFLGLVIRSLDLHNSFPGIHFPFLMYTTRSLGFQIVPSIHKNRSLGLHCVNQGNELLIRENRSYSKFEGTDSTFHYHNDLLLLCSKNPHVPSGLCALYENCIAYFILAAMSTFLNNQSGSQCQTQSAGKYLVFMAQTNTLAQHEGIFRLYKLKAHHGRIIANILRNF